MEFISTKGMTNETAPKGKVLVQYLEPHFGSYYVEFAIGYFDNPNDYNNRAGTGWKHDNTSNPIKVIAYANLPKPMDSSHTKLTQKEFTLKYGSTFPNLGSVGE